MTQTWEQYEAGKEYKRRIGLYETLRENERFYRGDQWQGGGEDLPKPVFNVIKRVVDYLVCSVAADRYTLSYTDENLPDGGDKAFLRRRKEALEIMSKNARYRWSRCRMDNIVYDLLKNAAITGDGIAYCYFGKNDGREGDICIETVDASCLFAADMNRADLQSQEYLILAGRENASALRAEALRNGVPKSEAAKILPDDDTSEGAGEYSRFELNCAGADKATVLCKFTKEGGRVIFEKATRDVVICRAVTPCTLYPVAYFNWTPTKGRLHGTSAVAEMIPNQKFINRGYAMVMKHMTDTAFSKILYDKTRIPEWSNEVGEAIGVVGATNVSDAVSVVGMGSLQNGYMELLGNALTVTKELMGATETALGNIAPTNTSAILALREASRISMGHIESALVKCIEDIGNIWADMMIGYYQKGRLLPYNEGQRLVASPVDFDALKKSLLRAQVEVTGAESYSAATTMAVLDKLFDKGCIDAATYLANLPEGYLPCRRNIVLKEEETHDAGRTE